MRITNGQVEVVLTALASVMASVVLPTAEACDTAEVLVALEVAHKKIGLVEAPIFAGRTTITTDGDPDAITRLNEFRALECDVEIPTLALATIKNSDGKVNAGHIALLLRTGIITND